MQSFFVLQKPSDVETPREAGTSITIARKNDNTKSLGNPQVDGFVGTLAFGFRSHPARVVFQSIPTPLTGVVYWPLHQHPPLKDHGRAGLWGNH